MISNLYDLLKDNIKMEIIMSAVLLLAVTFISCNMEKVTKSKPETTSPYYNGRMVVIDPGHGGKDPGKIGLHNVKEKDINLKISIELYKQLVDNGYQVYMTRADDNGINGVENSSKIEDLNNRCRIANRGFEKNSSCILISIHQNSFGSNTVHGAQCFYYQRSEKSRKLGNCIQDNLNRKINKDVVKKAKPNDSYYILINSMCPGAIIECGFLSNESDENKLKTNEFQNEIARVIREGIDSFFGQ